VTRQLLETIYGLVADTEIVFALENQDA